jgi:hypothetical protein
MRFDIIILRLFSNVETIELQSTGNLLFSLENSEGYLKKNNSRSYIPRRQNICLKGLSNLIYILNIRTDIFPPKTL